jgi:RNA polymerase sigma-70 factor (ECF subfamily)
MDDASFRSTVLEIKDRVYSYSVHLLRDAEEAKDVAQEALVRLWEHREDIRGVPEARSWTLRTAHNLAIDRIRLRRSRPRADESVLETRSSERVADPEREAVGRDAVERVAKGLDELSPEDRGVIVMREIQALTYGEIATVLDVPLGTVKARLHRARERLRTILVREGVRP